MTSESESSLDIRYHESMPRKIRELVRDLTSAGFIDKGGKGLMKTKPM